MFYRLCIQRLTKPRNQIATKILVFRNPRKLISTKINESTVYCYIGPKIKFHLFGIAARPTEKLAAQIILFAFQKLFFFYLKKIEIVPEFDRIRRVCS